MSKFSKAFEKVIGTRKAPPKNDKGNSGTSTADQMDGKHSDSQFRGTKQNVRREEDEKGASRGKEGKRQEEGEEIQGVEGSEIQEEGVGTQEEVAGGGQEEEGNGIQDEEGEGTEEEAAGGGQEEEGEGTEEEAAGGGQEEEGSGIQEEEGGGTEEEVAGGGQVEEGSGIQEEEGRTQEEDERGGTPVRYIGDVVDNTSLMDELAWCLDRQYIVSKYWKHMAEELNIPPEIRKGFEINLELSPTLHLFQFLSTNDPQLTIGTLRQALNDIHRNDLIEKFKDLTDTAIVVDVFENEPYLSDSIALELDSAKRPRGNWRRLASQLISTGPLRNKFEAQSHPSKNPTALLFRYLSTTEQFKRLTVADLKVHLKSMSRKDVLDALVGVQDGDFLANVFRPDSDLLNSVSNLLNKEIPGVGNWRKLAFLLGVSNNVYEEFDPAANSPKRRPTKLMLEWLRSKRPDMTVDELRTAVKNIGRADALKILED